MCTMYIAKSTKSFLFIKINWEAELEIEILQWIKNTFIYNYKIKWAIEIAYL